MKAEYAIFIGTFFGILLAHHTRSQTKFSLTEEKGGGKQEGKKQVPTFIGSDGVVRKVSPAAILEEMKRCLPPGLPIPLATAWPELPSHLEELQEAKDPKQEPQGTLDEGFQNLKDPQQNLQKVSQEKKRVSRSNDKNHGEMGVDVTNDQSMNVKLEGPTKDSGIFSPKDLNQQNMAEVLKAMLSRQTRRQNLTAEYVDDFNIRPRLHKPKQGDEYEDYDYIDPEVTRMPHLRAKFTNHGKRRNKNPFQTQRNPKRENRWKHHQQKPTRKQQMRIKNKPDYDYDYEESNEDIENQQYNKHGRLPKANTGDHIQSDELEKQIELNDFLEKNLLASDGIPERMENIDKFIKRSGHFKTRSGENINILEGYQKMLAVIMKLNTTLIRLLDKFSTLFQKDLPKIHPDLTGHNQNEDSGKSSVIWDFMDLLMQQRRGARNKRENGPYLPESLNTNTEVSRDPISTTTGTPNAIVNPPTGRTNMDLLKWLLKWYLSATSR